MTNLTRNRKDGKIPKDFPFFPIFEEIERIMTKIFGFTTILGGQHVIGLGSRCLVWKIYMAKVPRRRLKGFCFMEDASHIVFHMKCNSGGKFRFFGYVSIYEDDLRDE